MIVEHPFKYNPITSWNYGDDVAFEAFVNEIKEKCDSEDKVRNVDAIADLRWQFSRGALLYWLQEE